MSRPFPEPFDPVSTITTDSSSDSSSSSTLTNTASNSTTSTATPFSSPVMSSVSSISPLSSLSPTLTTSTSPSPSTSVVALTTSTHVNAGSIAGGVVGGAVFLALVLLGILLYLRNRKRKRTPPSSEFMNSLRPGDPPVLRPAFPEKAGFAHYPNATPLPSQRNKYYSNPPTLDIKLPEEMSIMMTDIPSRPPSIENVPLHPQRFSLQPQSAPKRNRFTGSVGSKRELWTRVVSRETSPVPRDSVLLFAPRVSSEESSTQLPISLQPLRRRPDQ